jgi:hypothetical protein
MSGKWQISKRFAQVSKAIKKNVYTDKGIKNIAKADIVNDQLSSKLQLSETSPNTRSLI